MEQSLERDLYDYEKLFEAELENPRFALYRPVVTQLGQRYYHITQHWEQIKANGFLWKGSYLTNQRPWLMANPLLSETVLEVRLDRQILLFYSSTLYARHLAAYRSLNRIPLSQARVLSYEEVSKLRAW